MATRIIGKVRNRNIDSWKHSFLLLLDWSRQLCHLLGVQSTAWLYHNNKNKKYFQGELEVAISYLNNIILHTFYIQQNEIIQIESRSTQYKKKLKPLA